MGRQSRAEKSRILQRIPLKAIYDSLNAKAFGGALPSARVHWTPRISRHRWWIRKLTPHDYYEVVITLSPQRFTRRPDKRQLVPALIEIMMRIRWSGLKTRALGMRMRQERARIRALGLPVAQ